MRISPILPALTLMGFLLSACTQAQTESADSADLSVAASTATPVAASDAPTSVTAAAQPATLPLVTVHKSPTCGCCKLWVTHLEQAGFPVAVVESDDLNPIKLEVGVPPGMGSCHTAQVSGYFIEGHVPADDIVRLITERPDVRGLAVPGMPMGSPGMEVPSGDVQPYAVQMVAKDGTVSDFSHHGN